MMNRLAHGTLTFTACSRSCARGGEGIGRWEVIHNAIRPEQYDYQPTSRGDSYLVFLGRVDRIKGAHTAIEVAKRTGKRLVIAGNVAPSGENAQYFREIIQPHLDGTTVSYIGPVDDRAKNKILGGAEALLFPIEWEEPFGIVMVEAMACGTPVIAFRRGAVPEVVTDGHDGFACDTIDEMADAVRRLGDIDRRACRQTVDVRFSQKVMAGQYLDLYKKILKGV